MTTELAGCVLGYDPGGNRDPGNDKGHGVAAVRVDEHGNFTQHDAVTKGTVSDVLKWFANTVQRLGPVRGIGIDTLAYWSSRFSGWRGADCWLRQMYGPEENSVAAQNSLHSSMTVNGMFVLRRLRQWEPRLYVTETHPKILYFALEKKPYSYPPERALSDEDGERRQGMNRWLAERMGICLPGGRESELTRTSHEWDALISAWAAHQGLARKWKENLVAHEDSTNLDFPAGPVDYRWPDTVAAGSWREAWERMVVSKEPARSQKQSDRQQLAV